MGQEQGWALTNESGEPAGTGGSSILRRGNKGHRAVEGVEGQLREGQGNKVNTDSLVQPRSKRDQMTMHCLPIATNICPSSCSGDDWQKDAQELRHMKKSIQDMWHPAHLPLRSQDLVSLLEGEGNKKLKATT